MCMLNNNNSHNKTNKIKYEIVNFIAVIIINCIADLGTEIHLHWKCLSFSCKMIQYYYNSEKKSTVFLFICYELNMTN